MPTDPTASLDSAPDPSEDTLADESQGTGEDTQGNTDVWERRYKDLQSHTSRQVATLKAELEALRSPRDQGSDEADEEYEEPEPVPQQTRRDEDRLTRDSWQLAETVYGQEAISAYERAARILKQAATPSDYVAAFEAYHQARLEASQPPRRSEQAPAQAEQPRVDSNRSDASPRNDFDRQAEEAFAKGDSRGFLLAQIRRVRGE